MWVRDLYLLQQRVGTPKVVAEPPPIGWLFLYYTSTPRTTSTLSNNNKMKPPDEAKSSHGPASTEDACYGRGSSSTFRVWK